MSCACCFQKAYEQELSPPPPCDMMTQPQRSDGACLLKVRLRVTIAEEKIAVCLQTPSGRQCPLHVIAHISMRFCTRVCLHCCALRIAAEGSYMSPTQLKQLATKPLADRPQSQSLTLLIHAELIVQTALHFVLRRFPHTFIAYVCHCCC